MTGNQARSVPPPAAPFEASPFAAPSAQPAGMPASPAAIATLPDPMDFADPLAPPEAAQPMPEANTGAPVVRQRAPRQASPPSAAWEADPFRDQPAAGPDVPATMRSTVGSFDDASPRVAPGSPPSTSSCSRPANAATDGRRRSLAIRRAIGFAQSRSHAICQTCRPGCRATPAGRRGGISGSGRRTSISGSGCRCGCGIGGLLQGRRSQWCLAGRSNGDDDRAW